MNSSLNTTFSNMFTQAKWQSYRAYENLSQLSKIGLLLLIATLLAYFFAYLPISTKLEHLQQDLITLQHPIATRQTTDLEENQYIASFPSLTTRASKLNELVEIAKQQELLLNQVIYKTESNTHLPLNRYQVEMSVLTSYPEAYRFISTVLQKMPFVALESLNLSRASGLDEAVETHIQFTFFFRRPT